MAMRGIERVKACSKSRALTPSKPVWFHPKSSSLQWHNSCWLRQRAAQTLKRLGKSFQ